MNDTQCCLLDNFFEFDVQIAIARAVEDVTMRREVASLRLWTTFLFSRYKLGFMKHNTLALMLYRICLHDCGCRARLYFVCFRRSGLKRYRLLHSSGGSLRPEIYAGQ